MCTPLPLTSFFAIIILINYYLPLGFKGSLVNSSRYRSKSRKLSICSFNYLFFSQMLIFKMDWFKCYLSHVFVLFLYISKMFYLVCAGLTPCHILSYLHSILCLLACNRACDAKYQNNCCPLCSIHGLTAVCCMAPLTC